MTHLSKREVTSSPPPPLAGRRTLVYAGIGFLLGVVLTVGGYLVDYHALYGGLPSSWSPGVWRGLHDITPVHYFADLFAFILAAAGGLAGWFQDRVVFYSTRLEELVEIRTRDLRRSEERYALAVEGSNDGIWDWDVVTNEVYYAPRWKQMIGCEDSDVVGRPETWLERVHPEDVERVREKIEAYFQASTSYFHVDYRMQHADGSYRWMLARGVAVRDPEGRPLRIAGSQTDIHDRLEIEDRLQHLVLHDPLTDLPNRTLLFDRMERILKLGSRRDTGVAVLHVGIDRFKKINESLGQLVGDRLLVEVGRRLATATNEFESSALSDAADHGPTGSVFRAGGDEFVLVLEEVRSLRDATRLADRILGAHAGPMTLEGREVLLSLSVGITMGPSNYRDASEILRDSQTAMHRAKAQGRARYEVFDREMLRTVEESLHLETELYQALETRQLRLWFQPIVVLGSRRVVGFEALVRWEHPQRGLISPGRFIPLAEETGLIVRLSQQLFADAFNQLKQWHDLLDQCDNFAINMNLSPKYLFHPELESDLGSLIQKTGVDPSRIHLEVTETPFVDRPKAVAEVLERLKRWGFRVALDDFGTEFSSLSVLHELPFDILKIDQRFVSQLGKDPDVRKIVATIVSLAQKLDLDAVAEGIETEEQLRELRSMRCKYGQGYLLGRPMNVEAAEELIRAGGKSRRLKIRAKAG
jgi:diguanylate cyclase (GGDEF)-like protein/PAS domain S-box-containing protein